MADDQVGEASPRVRTNFGRDEQVLLACFVLFTACLIISSVTADKLWALSLFGHRVSIPVGTSLFAITFLCTDVVGEVWGRMYSLYLVGCGALARVLALGFFSYAIWLEPASVWEGQQAYSAVLGGSSRIILAGITAYLVGQINDVFVFHYFREKDLGKNLLWKRNIVSTSASQLLESTVFIVGAFAGTLPPVQLVVTIFGQVLIKWVIALADTPFVYIVRNYAQGRPILDFRG
ncbi:MAG: queuosine precursor transporter [Salinivenus sp.]